MTYAAEDPQEQSIPIHERVFPDPTGDPGAYDWSGKSGAGDSPTGEPSESPWGTASGRGPSTRTLNRYLYKSRFVDYREDSGPNQANWKSDRTLDLSLLRCPGDRGYTGYHYES